MVPTPFRFVLEVFFTEAEAVMDLRLGKNLDGEDRLMAEDRSFQVDSLVRPGWLDYQLFLTA